jgi:hypothetical protein
VISVCWRPQLATFISRLPDTAEGKDKNELDRPHREQVVSCRHSAFRNDLGAEEGQAICGLSGHDATKSENLAAVSGAYSFSTRSPMDELASRKRVGSNRIIHRSAVSDPGKLS